MKKDNLTAIKGEDSLDLEKVLKVIGEIQSKYNIPHYTASLLTIFKEIEKLDKSFEELSLKLDKLLKKNKIN